MEKSQKPASQFYTSHPQSTSASAYISNDRKGNNNNNNFANVLTIGTDEDFDFPPPPPPPIDSLPGNEAGFSPDQLPSPPRIHTNLRNFAANSSSHCPDNSINYHANSSQIHVNSAAHNVNSPQRRANPPPLASPSFYHRYSHSTPSPHRHSSLNFVAQHSAKPSENSCSSSRSIGRCQLFEEMDERILRSRRAKHDNFQQHDCNEDNLACKLSPNRTFGQTPSAHCRAISMQDHCEPTSSNYYSPRDGFRPSSAILHSKFTKPVANARLTTSDLDDSSHSSSDQCSRDGEYLIKLGINPKIDKVHSANCESKNCCGRPSESEDSALPESSSSMSPTSSNASSSSVSGRLKWASEERNKENFGNTSARYPPGPSSSSHKSHLTPLGVHHANNNAAITGNNPKIIYSNAGVIHNNNNKPKFGYGKWVQNANGKWQRVDALNGDAANEMPRAHSVDRFATLHTKTPLNCQKFTPIRQFFGSSLKIGLDAANPPSPSRASSMYPLRTSSTLVLDGGRGVELPWNHSRNQSADTFWRRPTNEDDGDEDGDGDYVDDGNAYESAVWQQRSDTLARPTPSQNVNQLVKQLEGGNRNRTIKQKDRSPQCHNTSSQNYYNNNFQNADNLLSRDISTGLTIDAKLWRNAPQNYSALKTTTHESGFSQPITVLNASTAVLTTLKTTSVSSLPQNKLSYNNHSDKIYEETLENVAEIALDSKSQEEFSSNSGHSDSSPSTAPSNSGDFAEGNKVWRKAEPRDVERLLSSDKEASTTTTTTTTTSASTPAESVRADDELLDEDSGVKQSSGITAEQVQEIRNWLSASEITKYTFFTVCLKRSRGVEDGSVGLILTSAMPDLSKVANNDEFITIQRVITGSIADYDNRLLKGDRVFFIQHKSTRNMNATDARKLLKSPAPTVNLIVGRLTAVNNATLLKNASNTFYLGEQIASGYNYSDIFTTDPARECYDTDPTTVVLHKSELGVGLSLDGGVGSKFGDRPIVVKKVFAVGSAAKSGAIGVGDEVRSIDGRPLATKTQLEAWKILNSRPEGPVTFEIYKRIVPSAL